MPLIPGIDIRLCKVCQDRLEDEIEDLKKRSSKLKEDLNRFSQKFVLRLDM